nr:UV radiation resistance-associated gene protein [Mirounga angustirostris]
MSASASVGGPVSPPPPGPAASLPPGSAARALHVELPSQQRRLRHLRNIAARNIVNRSGHHLLDTYFTLHLCNTEKIYKEFYRSEVIKNSLVSLLSDRRQTIRLIFTHILFCFTFINLLINVFQGYSNAQKNILLQVDQNCVRNSYDVFSLLRLHRAQCAIKQTQVTVQKIGKEIEEKLRLTSTSNELRKQSECLQLKILVLRNELERQKKALGREVALLHKQQIALQDKGEGFFALHRKRINFILWLYSQNEHKDYFVCGVKLPNSEDFQAKDDGSIAVALGYTAHLVSMISFFLQVPLRYPIIHKGSRSTIKDNINDKLTEKEREFPLYPKGGEKLQFDYGVYLLNKNIAQLRYQHGLGTPDLRQTLPNLKNFMEHGLMVRCDRHHTSSAIPVPKRQSSVFGGADVGFSGGIPSPDKGHRKRASSENERLQYKTPPPSYNSALAQPVPAIPSIGESERKTTSLSSSLDTSLDFSKENKKKGVDLGDRLNGGHVSVNTSQEQEEALSGHAATVNGTLLPSEQAGSPGVRVPGDFRPVSEPELCCTVEQAEEIIGMEATGFTSGDQLEAFNCIPVDSAVAVECDEQVLGEFEEFSRRIYALNENVSSFRRPRRSSDK